ncbi:hypothetical protein HOLleu_20847 [Holothuria leucospilota]|uniref:Uncharacterized protein n=1 Tax=Holothuria leucospilota TaxID=206669 RepID=A0A9Q1BWW5_HOLLE|nr:hypothetical protein HOLleu_20847 [Holothuria leucospilota]
MDSVEFLSQAMSIKGVMRFSDGCASQYKSKGPFHDIAHYSQVTVEHHYFGSRYGKGPSDGESAVVKKAASAAVKGGEAYIPSARELFLYCEKKLSKGISTSCCESFKRSVFWVPKESVVRQREEPKTAVKGTRRIHAVSSTGDGMLHTRSLSCFCKGCRTDLEELCENRDVVDDWKVINFGGPISHKSNY